MLELFWSVSQRVQINTFIEIVCILWLFCDDEKCKSPTKLSERANTGVLLISGFHFHVHIYCYLFLHYRRSTWISYQKKVYIVSWLVKVYNKKNSMQFNCSNKLRAEWADNINFIVFDIFWIVSMLLLIWVEQTLDSFANLHKRYIISKISI